MKKNMRVSWKLSLFVVPLIIIMALATFALAVEVFRPVVTSVSPMNNVKDTPIDVILTATFSKEMTASSINTNTFQLLQRTAPADGIERALQLEGTVHYDAASRTATFIPTDPTWPNQRYGNVFTATITTGVKDDEGNAMEHPYVWSFTSGLGQYNTGANTSQQNETASLVGSSSTPPAASPPAGQVPVTTAPEASSASLWLSPYAFLVYFIILVLIGLILYAILRPKQAAVKSTTKQKDIGPFGDVHPVANVEGIGPVYAKRLAQLNIRNTQQLWQANARSVAASLGLATKTVRNWQQMAELMAVNGIGPQYAELLERTGVTSIEKLAGSDPTQLLKQLQQKQESLDMNIQGNPPGETIVASWIDSANKHQDRVRTQAQT